MKLDTESKMKFDSSISTEDRFALRKWFQKFIDFQNEENIEALLVLAASEVVITGFTKHSMDYETWAAFHERRALSEDIYTTRYPEVLFTFAKNRYRVSGSYEEYKNYQLVLEGIIDITIEKINNVFQLCNQTVYPRLIVRQQESRK